MISQMALLTVLLVVLSLSLTIENGLAYRPVIVMHGIFASNTDMTGFVDMIKTAYPGIEVSTSVVYRVLPICEFEHVKCHNICMWQILEIYYCFLSYY